MDIHLRELFDCIDQTKFTQVINESAPFCFLDVEGKFSYVSDALCALLQIDRDTLMSQSVAVLQPIKEPEAVASNFWELLKQQKEWQGAVRYITPNNGKLKLQCCFSLLENHDKPAYYFGQFEQSLDGATFRGYVENDLSYKWFFKNSTLPKSLFDLHTFQYADVNTAWENYTGFKKDDVLGLSPQQIKFHEVFDKELCKKIQTSNQESFVIDKGSLHDKSGDKKHAILTFEKISILKKAYLLEVINDISATFKYQKELKGISKKSVEKKDAILKLAGMIGGDLIQIFEEITKRSAQVLHVERVSIWEFNENLTALSCGIAYSRKDKKHCSEFEFKAINIPKYFEFLLKHKTLRVDDAQNNQITKAIADNYLKPLGITSTLDVVVPGHYAPYGVVCFEHIGPKIEWGMEDEEFATSIANIISLAVECQKRGLAEVKLTESNDKLLALNAELHKLKKGLEQENIYLREEIGLVFNYEEMVYGSKSFSRVLTEVESVAATNATVLLLGESGTGKELLARAIHNISARKNKPLIKVNCAAIPRELIESELFGHKKGSFTGAINDKLGKFQLADGGTLFLDEIGELPMEMQPKLLRAIQESEIEQVGGVKTQKVDIRIIAATNRDLEKEIKEKNFREDLFFRINVFPITIPPLRDRNEDIPILIEHFVNKYTKLYNKKITYISEATKRNLQAYPWPGNVRELENLIERAVIVSNDDVLMMPDFKSSPKESLISATSLSLEDVQRIHIKKILKQCHWKIDGIAGAADVLQIKPSTLRDRMKKLGIEKV